MRRTVETLSFDEIDRAHDRVGEVLAHAWESMCNCLVRAPERRRWRARLRRLNELSWQLYGANAYGWKAIYALDRRDVVELQTIRQTVGERAANAEWHVGLYTRDRDKARRERWQSRSRRLHWLHGVLEHALARRAVLGVEDEPADELEAPAPKASRPLRRFRVAVHTWSATEGHVSQNYVDESSPVEAAARALRLWNPRCVISGGEPERHRGLFGESRTFTGKHGKDKATATVYEDADQHPNLRPLGSLPSAPPASGPQLALF